MSFALDWLLLRERVDHRSRAQGITLAARERLQARWSRTGRPISIVDLGGGPAGNLRFLADQIRLPQRWTILDNDAALLSAAADRIESWRRSGALPPTVLDVALHHVDLAEAPLPEIVRDADLVTASALLDLVSQPWRDALIEAMARRKCAFLAALTFDGRMRWTIEDACDPLLVRLVNRHQETDKGFGPALGARAAPSFAEALEASGASVVSAESDWLLDADEAAIQSVLLGWWAEAARQVAPAQAPTIDGWLGRRRHRLATDDSVLVVGHRDLLAVW